MCMHYGEALHNVKIGKLCLSTFWLPKREVDMGSEGNEKKTARYSITNNN